MATDKANAKLFFGDEYQSSRKAAECVERIVPQEDRAFGLETIEGTAGTAEEAVSAVRRCIEALQTVGFLCKRKVVWFRDVAFLTDNQIGAVTEVKARLDELAAIIKAGLQEGQILVLSATSVDKRRILYKAFQSNGEIEESAVLDIRNAKSREIQEYTDRVVREALDAEGLASDSEARKVFADRVGPDARQAAAEARKLATALGDRKRLTADDVQAIVTLSREIPGWDLAEAFGDRDAARAYQVLHRLLLQGEEGIAIAIGLEGRIRDLLVFREAMDRGWFRPSSGRGGDTGWGKVPPEVDEAFSQMQSDPRRGHPFRMKKLADQAARFKRGRLVACLQATLETHEKLVTTSGVKPSDLLEALLARLMA